MFYYLFSHHAAVYSNLSVFRSITFRTVLATVTALLSCLVPGPWLIRKLSAFQVAETIRDDGPQGHQAKAGTPTMEGILIIVGALVPTFLWADIMNPHSLVLMKGTLK